MMGKPLRVLMVEDSDDDVLLMTHALRKGGYEATYERVEDASSMRKVLEKGPWDVILCDFQMPRFNGLDAISLLKEIDRNIPLIIVSGAIGEETAVECMRRGASDYVMKGSLSRLIPAVERELKEAESRGRRRRAEEALKRSELEKTAILESMTDLVTYQNRDMTVLWTNRAAAQSVGLTKEELVGRRCYELWPRGSEPCVGCPVRLAHETGCPQSTEMVTPDGRNWFIRAFPVIDQEGYIAGVVEVTTDTTERKRSVRDLQESEERYRSLFANSRDAILLTRPDGLILDANPAACKMFGWSLGEIRKIGRNGLVDVTDPRLAEALSERQYKESATAELLMLRANGDKFPAEVTSTIFLDAGGQQKSSMIIRDITERVQAQEEQRGLEAQLRHAQRMEAISTLAGGIAHDFNNILSAVMGYAQLAQMKLDQETEPYEDLKQVVQSANRAKLLIGQILAVGRGQEQEKQPMQLKYTVKEALNLLRSTLPSTVEIRETYDKDVGIIDADPTQMHQVLMNLCTNADHAMQENGGLLLVSLQNAEIGKGSAQLNLMPGAYVRLSVSDTGAGMTPEIMERIFDPYFTTKKKGEGTGIGLSVVHAIVTQHGGTVLVESEPGKGSAFHVYLPSTRASEEKQKIQTETPVPTGQERILFVDDEPALAMLGKKMLEGLGYTVTAMTGSLDSLELFRSDPEGFDLVITDTTMPHMSGDILAQEMMKIRPDIPVVITTGHSRRISEKKAEELGLKGFIMKPFIVRDLAETVRKALDG